MVGFGLSLRDHSVFCLNILPNPYTMTTLFQTVNIKKILVVLLVCLTVFFVFFSKNIVNLITNKPEVVLGAGDQLSVFQSALHPIYGTPKRIVINSLTLKIDVISVGVDLSGYIETPKDWNVAGWYSESTRPGETGNMLIDGHYDDNYGRPAAFWKLKNLKTGDRVSILDSFGRSYDYSVVDSYYVDINDPERMKVIEGPKDTPALTLITCGGVWMPGEHTYNKRLVISAELVQD